MSRLTERQQLQLLLAASEARQNAHGSGSSSEGSSDSSSDSEDEVQTRSRRPQQASHAHNSRPSLMAPPSSTPAAQTSAPASHIMSHVPTTPAPTRQNKNSPPPVWLPADFPLWTEERKTLWRNLAKNPGKYYYRFTPPGIPRRNAPWSAAERRRFEALLETRPFEGEWGYFSMLMPGRTGQQCERFYDQLRKETQLGAAGQTGYEVGDEDGRAGYTVPASSTALIKAALEQLQTTLGHHRKQQAESQATPRKETRTPQMETSPAPSPPKNRAGSTETAEDEDIYYTIPSSLLNGEKGKDGQTTALSLDDPLANFGFGMPPAATGASHHGRKRISAPPVLSPAVSQQEPTLPPQSLPSLRAARAQLDFTQPQLDSSLLPNDSAASLKASALGLSPHHDMFTKRPRAAPRESKDVAPAMASSLSSADQDQGQKFVRVNSGSHSTEAPGSPVQPSAPTRSTPPTPTLAASDATDAAKALAMAMMDTTALHTKLTPDLEDEGMTIEEAKPSAAQLSAAERSLLERAANGLAVITARKVPALRILHAATLAGTAHANPQGARAAMELVDSMTPADLTAAAAADVLASAALDTQAQDVTQSQQGMTTTSLLPRIALAATSRLPHTDSIQDAECAKTFGSMVPSCDPVAHLRQTSLTTKLGSHVVSKSQPAISNPVDWTTETSQRVAAAYEDQLIAARLKARERSQSAAAPGFGFFAGCRLLKCQMDPDKHSNDPLRSTSPGARERYSQIMMRDETSKQTLSRSGSGFSRVAAYEAPKRPSLSTITEMQHPTEPQNATVHALATHGLIVPKTLVKSVLVNNSNPSQGIQSTDTTPESSPPRPWNTVEVPGSGFRRIVYEHEP